jgi:phosphatidylethanolamine-binding protein (PEBP) family uncharacterized protein
MERTQFSDRGSYHGPWPEQRGPPHRDTFTIYALNVAMQPVPADSTGDMVTSIAQEHLLGKAVFVAHYGRPKSDLLPVVGIRGFAHRVVV